LSSHKAFLLLDLNTDQWKFNLIFVYNMNIVKQIRMSVTEIRQFLKLNMQTSTLCFDFMHLRKAIVEVGLVSLSIDSSH
jgi:hypothetical protein